MQMETKDYFYLGAFAVLLYLWWDARKRLTALEAAKTTTAVAQTQVAKVDYLAAYNNAKLL